MHIFRLKSVRITNTSSNFNSGKDILLHVPSLWVDISSRGLYQGTQVSTWNNSSTHGDSVSGLPRWHSYPPPEQGGTRMLSSSDLQSVQSFRFGNQHQKIHMSWNSWGFRYIQWLYRWTWLNQGTDWKMDSQTDWVTPLETLHCTKIALF